MVVGYCISKALKINQSADTNDPKKAEIKTTKQVKVSNQRVNKDPSPERKKELDDLGFVWKGKKGPKNK